MRNVIRRVTCRMHSVHGHSPLASAQASLNRSLGSLGSLGTRVRTLQPSSRCRPHLKSMTFFMSGHCTFFLGKWLGTRLESTFLLRHLRHPASRAVIDSQMLDGSVGLFRDAWCERLRRVSKDFCNWPPKLRQSSHIRTSLLRSLPEWLLGMTFSGFEFIRTRSASKQASVVADRTLRHHIILFCWPSLRSNGRISRSGLTCFDSFRMLAFFSFSKAANGSNSRHPHGSIWCSHLERLHLHCYVTCYIYDQIFSYSYYRRALSWRFFDTFHHFFSSGASPSGSVRLRALKKGGGYGRSEQAWDGRILDSEPYQARNGNPEDVKIHQDSTLKPELAQHKP